MTNALKKAFIYHKFKKVLITEFGKDTASQIWENASEQLAQLQRSCPDCDRDSRMMILPAAALYRSLKTVAPDRALPLLVAYGTRMGKMIACIVHGITSIPGISKLLWKKMPQLMRKMSAPDKGYTRRIVSETDELVGVDILSCPLHDTARNIGVPEAALVVCAMDKAYMTGFRYIHYTRTTSVAEGAECCDYRLRFDADKK